MVIGDIPPPPPSGPPRMPVRVSRGRRRGGGRRPRRSRDHRVRAIPSLFSREAMSDPKMFDPTSKYPRSPFKRQSSLGRARWSPNLDPSTRATVARGGY